VTGHLGRRIGRWQYDRRVGWRLDGTTIVIDRVPVSDGTYCYVIAPAPPDAFDNPDAWGTPHQGEQLDRYLAASMEWVEQHLARYTC
jgi:hypothetical protein